MKNYNYSKNKHCKCGKLIIDKAKNCPSCANKGQNHWNYIDGRTNKKYYCTDCRKELGNIYATKCGECYHKSRKGVLKYNITKQFLIREYTVNKKPSSQIAKELGCSPGTIKKRLIKYGIPIRTLSEANKLREITPEWRKNLSKALKGKNKGKKSHWFGKKGKEASRFGKISHGKGEYYKNIWMRSSWEILYAKYLDNNGVDWQYEPKAFELGNTTYTPDFYLPKKDLYIEIKGYWRDDAKQKFDLFKRLYSKIRIKLMMKSGLEKLGILK